MVLLLGGQSRDTGGPGGQIRSHLDGLRWAPGERTSRGRWLKGLVGAQMLIVHFKVVRISVLETLAFSLLPSPPKSSATGSTPMTALCEYSRRGEVK